MYPVNRRTFEMDGEMYCLSDSCSYSSQLSPRSCSPTSDVGSPQLALEEQREESRPLITAQSAAVVPVSDVTVQSQSSTSSVAMNSVCQSSNLATPTSTKHPLLHSLVLYNTLQYLPLKDLLNCRLVCSTWDTEVCRLLRKNLTLEFQDICHINNFKQLMDENVKKKPDRDNPFARISLRSTFRLGHDIAQGFFKIHGHLIKHITITKVGCDCGANFFQKLLFYQTTNLTSLNLQIIAAPIRLSPLSEYCEKYVRVKKVPKRLASKWRLPNLTQLHLRHQLFYERPKFIEDLLEAVVNLEELTTDEANPLFCRNCFVPAVLASRNRWNKLKKIQVGDMVCLSNEDMLKLAERNLNLECLPLNFNICAPNFQQVDMANLLILLKSVQHSLKKLDLFNHRSDFLLDFQWFPSMKRLEQLKTTNIHFPSRFLELLPNLQVLSICHEAATLYTSFFSFNIPPHPTLSNVAVCPLSILSVVHLRTWMGYWQSKAESYVGDLASAFPHLRKLSISGNDDVLKCIYNKLPLLEELTIYGPITDEGITGIALSKCQQMQYEKDYGLMDSEELEGIKFIGDLSRLKKMTIYPLGTLPMLTEVSVFLGFICCKDLITLDISNKELTSLWEQEVKRIRGHPQSS